MMVERNVIVRLETGLHARPAARFVQKANQYQADIYIVKGNKKVNAKSIMGVMSLAVARGTEITIVAEGKDEQKAVEALVEIVSQTS